MGGITEQVDALVLTETTPDGLVDGVHTGVDGVTLSFRQGHYRHYTERTLEPQLTALFTRLTAAYRRAHAEILARATGREARYFLEPPRDPDARTNRLRAELARLAALREKHYGRN